jgi:hypothetical protein
MESSALSNAEFWLSAIGTAKLVAAFLVAAGVAIEFGGDWASIPFEKTVKEARESQEATLRNETMRLVADAETSRTAALQAQFQLEQLRKLAPKRFLGPEFVAALKEQPSGQFAIIYPSNDSEARELSVWVYGRLEEAGWKAQSAGSSLSEAFRAVDFPLDHVNLTGVTIIPPSSAASAGMGHFVGRMIYAEQTRLEASSPPLAALVKAFADSLGDISIGAPNAALPADTFQIVVGPRPRADDVSEKNDKATARH